MPDNFLHIRVSLGGTSCDYTLLLDEAKEHCTWADYQPVIRAWLDGTITLLQDKAKEPA